MLADIIRGCLLNESNIHARVLCIALPSHVRAETTSPQPAEIRYEFDLIAER